MIILLIIYDLGVVCYYCDCVVVMLKGVLVEINEINELFINF